MATAAVKNLGFGARSLEKRIVAVKSCCFFGCRGGVISVLTRDSAVIKLYDIQQSNTGTSQHLLFTKAFLRRN